MPELTQEQRAELRAKAQAATRGPWMVLPPVIIGGNNDVATPHDGERHRSIATRALPENAAFIAAADPPTVLALLDALEEAEQQRADWIAAWHTEHDVAVTARAVSRRQPYSAAQ
jgi:hypothetical protein